jgi:hypothetical protein
MWRRPRDEASTAINDLILLAQNLPEDKQKEIFSLQSILQLKVHEKHLIKQVNSVNMIDL